MNVVVITKSPDEFRRALSSPDTDIQVFDSGEQGLAYWRAEKPGLVFCDTTMPDINGFRIAKTIANEKGCSETDVYLMSGSVKESDELWAKKQGATGVIECNFALVHKIVMNHQQTRLDSPATHKAESVDVARLNEIDQALCKELGPVAFILSEEARSMLKKKNALTPEAYTAHLARHILNSAGRQRFLDQFLGL